MPAHQVEQPEIATIVTNHVFDATIRWNESLPRHYHFDSMLHHCRNPVQWMKQQLLYQPVTDMDNSNGDTVEVKCHVLNAVIDDDEMWSPDKWNAECVGIVADAVWRYLYWTMWFEFSNLCTMAQERFFLDNAKLKLLFIR